MRAQALEPDRARRSARKRLIRWPGHAFLTATGKPVGECQAQRIVRVSLAAQWNELETYLHQNPYESLDLQTIYDGLIAGRFGPRWPDEKLQAGYTGTNKIDLLRRAFSFVELLENEGAFVEDWKGLDYGCGWGRFASVILSKGRPEQLDLCDAWQVTLHHIARLGYENRIFKVPSLLEAGSLPEDHYDFILSFSVFTHLSPLSFERNMPVLKQALKPSGEFYFTVRHDEFLDHKYPQRADELREVLEKDEVVFLDSGGDMYSRGNQADEKLFGDSIITKAYLERFGNVRYLGQPHSLQHVYALSR